MSDSSNTSYIRTTDYEKLIEGREAEVLRHHGLDAGKRTGSSCAYGCGESKMRYEPQSRRVYCYCTPKGDSVADFVMKCEGLGEDFDAGKVRVAQILGADTLIRTRRSAGKAGPRKAFVRSDAKSLLKPPAALRDDALGPIYVGSRLKVAPADVLMPNTAVVGISAMPYFEQGAKGEKPIEVGTFGCVVFEMVGPEGQRHAQRVYVGPGGQGKADLGLDASGEKRPAKKSATVPTGAPTTTGLCALWGDASAAPTMIVGEGPETMAAVAYAFRQEIEAGEIVVASAMTAGGIVGLKLWPATKTVIVAADRDEAVEPGGKRPHHAGENAARDFGQGNHGRVEVRIAMPGLPDTSADWLDVLLADGIEAVRTGILGAVPYAASADERDEEQRRTDSLDEVARIARDYPVPTISGHALQYREVEGEVWLCARKTKGEEVTWAPVCTPFGFPERTRLLDGDGTFGLRLAVLGLDGRRRVVEVERESLGRVGGAEIRARLYALGLRVQGDGERIVVELLKAASPEREVAIVRAPGWHMLDQQDGQQDGVTFVCPGGEVYGAPEGQPLELGVNARMTPRTARGGTLEGWQTAVEAAVSVEGCPHWALGVLAGLAGPLISLCRLDTCGINVSGITSTGKSTAQRLAASIWSRPLSTVDDSLFQTARATANGTESMAARASGTVLVLDELGHMSGKELGRIIYGLAAGTGKRRMTADARMRAVQTWSTFVFLSAEKTLREKIQGDGGEWADGMAVRIVDINVTGVNRGIPKETFGQIDGVRKHYGHAGPRFVEALVSSVLNTAEKAEEISQGIARVAEGLAAGGKGVDTRAATPFAIMQVAGELAQTLRILPLALDVRGTIAWAWGQFSGSPDAVALKPEEQVVTNIQAWTARNWGSSIFPTVTDLDRPPNREAAGWHDATTVYVERSQLVKAAGGTLSELQVARILKDRGLLTKTHDDTTYYYSRVPQIGSVKVYALDASVFGRGSDGTAREEEAARLTVIPGGRP